MFEFISNTPPETALLLGLFMGLSLRQGRISVLLDRFLPGESEQSNVVETPNEDPRGDGE